MTQENEVFSVVEPTLKFSRACTFISAGDRWWNKYYHMFVLSTQYVIPVIIMAYCYAMMAITIWRNKDLVNAEVAFTYFKHLFYN